MKLFAIVALISTLTPTGFALPHDFKRTNGTGAESQDNDHSKGHGNGHGEDKSYHYVYDDFSESQLSIGSVDSKFSYFAAGDYIGNDGIVSTGPNGVEVVSPGTNPKTGEPAFTLTLPAGRPDSDNEHVKFLAFANHNSSRGYVGFDTEDGYIFSCGGRFGGQLYGINDNPFKGLAGKDEAQFGSLNFAVADLERGWIFNAIFTNSKIYASYERLASARTPENKYASFTYTIPIARRRAGDEHHVRVAFDRSEGTVTWYIDGEAKYSASNLGYYLDDEMDIRIDRGGVEEAAGDINQLTCGFGMVSLLDGYNHAKQVAYVRLNPEPGYYVNPETHSGNVTFFDNENKPENRLWGQGGRLHLRELIVSNQKKCDEKKGGKGKGDKEKGNKKKCGKKD